MEGAVLKTGGDPFRSSDKSAQGCRVDLLKGQRQTGKGFFDKVKELFG